MSEDRRTGKLHKQVEVEHDDAVSEVCGGKNAKLSGDIERPCIQSSSNSSCDTSQPRTVIPPPMIRKQTLIRGQALDGNSPPPESFFSQIPQIGDVQNGHTLTNGGAGSCSDNNDQLTGQSYEVKEFLLTSHKASNDSGHGTLDHNDDASDTSVLSRESSLENAAVHDLYRDSSGVNIPKFMRDTLLKSAKDRKAVLSYEDELLNFINNDNSQVYKMGEMTSYDRMIVHRLAAFLGLEHNVDSTGRCVILNRTENTRNVKLSELVHSDGSEHEPKKRILLKKPFSFDVPSRGNNKAHFGSHRAKSLEERQQHYMEARERIFKSDEAPNDDICIGQNMHTLNTPAHLSPHQQAVDSPKSNGQSSNRWRGSESSGYESVKSSPNTQPAISSSSCQSVCAPPPPSMLAASDHSSHGYKPVIEPAPSSTLTHAQTHADSTLYHFDPTCPPPFMVQPTTHPPPEASPAGSLMAYPSDNISDVTTRFAATSLRSLDAGSEPFVSGAPSHPIPLIVPHPQSMYQPQFTQGQYLVTPSHVPGQQHIRYIAVPCAQEQTQTLLPGAGTVDSQQVQTTVPMPAVGVPAMLGVGGYQVMGAPYQSSVAVGGSSPHCVDLNSVTYHYGAVPETMLVGGTGNQGASHLFLAYPQPQHAAVISNHHLSQYTPTGTAPQGTFYTIPAVSTSTPPLPLAQQPPPPSPYLHHHQQQSQQHHQPPAVFYTPALSSSPSYTVPVSNPSSSSVTSYKPVASQLIPTPYHHIPASAQHQPMVLSPSNGHHPSQLTFNYAQPIPFSPGQPVGQVATLQGSQLVTVQTSPYQIRPVGTVLQLAGGSVVPTPQLGPGQPLQSYQILRPGGSVPELRFVNPGSVRTRLSPLQTTAATDQSRYSNYYHVLRKGSKKLSREMVDTHNNNQATTTQQQMGHTNIIIPYISTPLPHPHQSAVPPPSSSSSNRQ